MCLINAIMYEMYLHGEDENYETYEEREEGGKLIWQNRS